MKNNRKKVISIGEVNEREDYNRNGRQAKKFSDSNSSSDFSQFELNPMNLKNSRHEEFSPFTKPKGWKEAQDETKIFKKINQKQLKKRPESAYGKVRNKKDRKQNKISLQKPVGGLTISFKKRPSKSQVIVPEILHKKSKHQRHSNSQSQQLISEYDKTEFNSKNFLKRCEQWNKNLERSRSKYNQKQMKQTGMIETRGGLCFDVDVADFPCSCSQVPITKQRRTKRAKKAKNISHNQQLLRRRQIVFRYGQLIRRRTFNYY